MGRHVKGIIRNVYGVGCTTVGQTSSVRLHIYVPSHMTEISFIVTLNNQLTSRQPVLAPREVERQQWGEWFWAALPHIYDSLWVKFQASSLQIVESFRQRSKTLEQQERHNQHSQGTNWN